MPKDVIPPIAHIRARSATVAAAPWKLRKIENTVLIFQLTNISLRSYKGV
jgi:hypothetical protein